MRQSEPLAQGSLNRLQECACMLASVPAVMPGLNCKAGMVSRRAQQLQDSKVFASSKSVLVAGSRHS